MKQITHQISRITRISGQTLVVSLMLLPVFLYAVELEENQVRSAVETWVRYETADARPDAIVASMQPWVDNGKVTAYIAHLENGGFCICGADTRVLPVYFYSPRGVFDEEIEDYQYVLWEIGARLAYMETAAQLKAGIAAMIYQALADRSRYWQQLIDGVPTSRIEADGETEAAPSTMILNMTSLWDQRSPENDLCPTLTPGPVADEHVKVGCVAIAMAQIMNYWQWPVTGMDTVDHDYEFQWRTDWDDTLLSVNPRPDWGTTSWSWNDGDGRLAWTSDNGGQLRMFGYWDWSLYREAQEIDEDDDYLDALETLYNRLNPRSTPNVVDLATRTYNYGIMPDDPVDPNDAGDLEVAELCYHAGISVKMKWGVKASGSSIESAISAFEEHFFFDPDGFISSPPSASQLIEEIEWMRPAFLRGRRDENDGGGGHVWVAYGFNRGIPPDDQFYINLGWGGTNDGWYTLDSMPSDKPFYLEQKQGIYVAPTSVRFVGAANAGDGSPDDPYIDIDEARIEAPDNCTLVFKAGSTNTFAGSSLVLNRPMTLKGYDVRIE